MTLCEILSSPGLRAVGVLGAVTLEWPALATGLTAAALLLGGLALAWVRSRRAAQRQARKLRASDERFRRYADASQQGIWMTDARGKVAYVNPRLAQYLGGSVQEIVGSPSREFVVEAQRTGRPEQQVRLRRKDGSTLWTPLYESPLTDGEGRAAGALGLFNDLDLAERKRAETALRASEAEFNATFELMGGGKAQTDPATGRFLRVNRQLCYMTGYSNGQLLTMTLPELAHPDDRPEIEDLMSQASRATSRSGPQRSGSSTRPASSSGPTPPAHWSATPTAGRCARCWSSRTSPTARRPRRKSSASTATSSARVDELQTLLDVVPVGIAVAQDAECRQIILNPAGQALLGVPAGVNPSKTGPESDRLPFRIFRDGREIPGDRLPMQHAARHNLPIRDHEIDVVRADGRTLNLLEYATPLHDEHRQVRGCLGVFVDITTRKHAENLLRDSEERFRRLADSMPQIVWSARSDGVIDYFNQRWYDFTGFPEGQSGTSSMRQILHPEDADEALRLWRQAVAGGEAYQTEYRLCDRRTGEYRWHLGRALPMRDANGRVVRWFGTATDIDDHKRAEQALVEADRRKDEFLAMLAHELRNPLAPIRNALGILRHRGPEDALLSEAHDMMERQVRQLVRLVDDLLDVSRITRGKIKLQKEPVELKDVVKAALETSRPLIEERQHRLTVQLPPDPVPLQADPARLSQVLANLLNNAAKYTERGGRIDLTAERDGADVVVRVRDTGVGIAPEMLPHVFDLFAQADSSLDRTLGGLGIGLTIVRSLVEMHGGQVQAHSDGIGQGSEFVVTLPVLTGGTASRNGSEPHHAGDPEPTQSVKVLVVEDHPDAAYSIALLLNLWGHEVRLAHESKTALEIAQAFQPQVVLLDIGLPEVDGYQIARQLRRQEGLEGVKLIALTGYGQDEDRRRSREAGFDLHLVKPVTPETLHDLLAQG